MAVAARAVIDRALAVLNDPDGTYWSATSLLANLSEAQKAVVLLRPEANPVTAVHALVTGSRQQIPADGFVLIDVIRNMGAAGDTPGRSVTPVARGALDMVNPLWQTQPADTVENFIYDIRNRKTFYVSPPQPNPPVQRLEVIYAATPADLAAVTDNVGIDDIYAPALVEYVLYKAFSRDLAAAGQGEGRAQFYFDRFQALLVGNAEQKEADITIRHEVPETGRT